MFSTVAEKGHLNKAQTVFSDEKRRRVVVCRLLPPGRAFKNKLAQNGLERAVTIGFLTQIASYDYGAFVAARISLENN